MNGLSEVREQGYQCSKRTSRNGSVGDGHANLVPAIFKPSNFAVAASAIFFPDIPTSSTKHAKG